MRVLAAAVLALTLNAPAVQAADEMLPRGLTPAERKYIEEHREEYLRDKLRPGFASEKPEDLLIAPAEHQPLEGVAFGWTAMPTLLTPLVTEVSKNARAFVAVKNEADEASARQRLAAAGANMANVTFDRVAFNSIWMRDYGPNIAYTKDGDRVVIDLAYNRPRPLDDAYPQKFAAARNITVHSPPLILPGGNLIIDGSGVAVMTDMVFDPAHGSDPNLSNEQLATYFKDYFGCHKVLILEQMKEDGTGHADMFCKLLNDETWIVGEYENEEDGAEDNKRILDRNAAKLAAETNGAGKPYRVVRMPMPRFDNGISRTYTNSLIVNDKVLVPQYGDPLDSKALEIYRALMPGAQVIGFDCSEIIRYNGAIHCITHEINADPLTVTHTPPAVTTPDVATPLTCKVDAQTAVSNVHLYWRSGCGAAWWKEPMTEVPGRPGEYTVDLQALPDATMIQYYFRAEDSRGMHETFPEDANGNNALVLVIGENGKRHAQLPGLSQLLGLQ